MSPSQTISYEAASIQRTNVRRLNVASLIDYHMQRLETKARLEPYLWRLDKAFAETDVQLIEHVAFNATFHHDPKDTNLIIWPTGVESATDLHGLFLAQFGHEAVDIPVAAQTPAVLRASENTRLLLARTGSLDAAGVASVTYVLRDPESESEFQTAVPQIATDTSQLILSQFVDFSSAIRH
ncbi:MAG: hypothetical protein JWM81_879 [Candidatus Saccharibacteria bacterium]|nr:hypothetical protein [Candidatus Saccharibacteria bacterium]